MATATRRRIGIQRLRDLRLGGLLNKGIWGLADQSIISASNFVTTVVLARTLSPAAFGTFVLVYAAIFFVNSLQSALVTRPHNVLGATRDGAEYRRYTTATAMSQLCLTGALALLAVLCAVIAHRAAWGVAPLLVPLVPALIAWQLQEFIRRVLYTEGRLKIAFIDDLMSYGCQAVGIAVLGRFGHLTGERTLWIIALTSAIAVVWCVRQVAGSFDRDRMWREIRANWFAENWRFGKWIFGAALAASVCTQFYAVLIGGMVSVAEAGAFSAMLTLMGPARILLLAMDAALTPSAARAFGARGQPALRSFVARIFVFTAPVSGLYCVVVAVFAGPIIAAVYGDHYRAYGWLLAFLALGYAIEYLRLLPSIALEARQASAPVFHAFLWSALSVLTVGVAAVHWFGLRGAAVGTTFSAVVLCGSVWRLYLRATATKMTEAIPGRAYAFSVPGNPIPLPLPSEGRGDSREVPWRSLHTRLSRQLAPPSSCPEGARTIAEYAHRCHAPRTRTAARASVIPLWEKGFAVLGIFLCLDAGVRTLRILGGVEGPIQSVASAEVDYSQGSALTQILLFAVYLVSLMLLAIYPTQQLTRALRAKFIWLLPALAMVSVVWSGASSISFRRAVALLGSSIFGLYLATRFPRLELLRVVLAASVVVIILSLLTIVVLPTYGIDESGAWVGVFNQKNHLGRFMALSAVLWLVYAASVRRHRFLMSISLVSATLVVFSRSATSVALLFALIALLLFVRLVRLRPAIALPALVLVLTAVGYLAIGAASNPGRVTALLGRDTSLSGRTQLWSLVWQMIRTHLWFGYGYGGFWRGFEGPSAPVWYATGWNPPTAHDGYLDLMLDLGVVGLLIFVPVMLVAIRYAFALARRGRTLDAAFPLIFLAFYLLSNITESYLVTHNTESWVLFVAITLQLHMWWHEEGRARPRIAARAAIAPARRPPVSRPIPSIVPKGSIALQEGSRMPAQVTVSAIMPTYNAMPHLQRAIDSVLAQTFTDWELIVVDDGSTDGTHALLEQYDDPRIRVFELRERGGIAKARTIALGFACGKYIAIAEDDAISLPERFGREVAYLESHREVHVVASQIKHVHGDERSRARSLYPEEPEAIQRRFAKGRMAIPFSTAMIRSWCFDRFGPFREDLARAEDLEWCLRVRRSCNFRVLPEALCLNRHRTGGATLSQWRVETEYERYAAYRAGMFGASADRTVMSFDRFTRRWGARFGRHTRDVLRFVSSRRRSNATDQKLRSREAEMIART